MVKRICLAFVAVIFAGVFCLSAAAQDVKKPTGQYKGSIRGEKYSYKYTEQDFADTPSWKVEDGEPPLSVSRALQIAKTNLARFVEGSDDFKVRRVTMHNLRDDKWFYDISFVCMGAPCRNFETRQFQIIVKMDGSILEPKKLIEVD